MCNNLIIKKTSMKKNLIIIVCILILVGCSNDYNSLVDKENSTSKIEYHFENNKDLSLYINSIKDPYDKIFYRNSSKKENNLKSLSSPAIQIMTLKGYSFTENDGYHKGWFGGEHAQKLGIIPGSYIFTRLTVVKKFKKDSNMFIIPGYKVQNDISGYMPSSIQGDEPIKGFSYEVIGDDVYLRTYFLYIKCDAAGNTVNVYNPLGMGFDLNNLVWNVPYMKIN